MCEELDLLMYFPNQLCYTAPKFLCKLQKDNKIEVTVSYLLNTFDAIDRTTWHLPAYPLPRWVRTRAWCVNHAIEDCSFEFTLKIISCCLLVNV